MDKPEYTPDRFDLAFVDSKGNFLPLDKTTRHRPPQSIPRNNDEANEEKRLKLQALSEALNFDQYPSDRLNALQDGIYNIREDTVKNRIESGKIPGGVWDAHGRQDTPPQYSIGPGDYEVYDGNLTNTGLNVVHGGNFNEQPSGREYATKLEPEFLPFHERKRYNRRLQHMEAKLLSSTRSCDQLGSAGASLGGGSIGDSIGLMSLTGGSLSSTAGEMMAGTGGSLGSLATGVKSAGGSVGKSTGGGTIGGSTDRFNALIYRQESFVKTSGMRLSGDWDKHLTKKIPFSFQPPSHSKKKSMRSDVHKSEGADVDVDVGHMFSIVRLAALSPVKYSSAFRFVLLFCCIMCDICARLHTITMYLMLFIFVFMWTL